MWLLRQGLCCSEIMIRQIKDSFDILWCVFDVGAVSDLIESACGVCPAGEGSLLMRVT